MWAARERVTQLFSKQRPYADIHPHARTPLAQAPCAAIQSTNCYILWLNWLSAARTDFDLEYNKWGPRDAPGGCTPPTGPPKRGWTTPKGAGDCHINGERSIERKSNHIFSQHWIFDAIFFFFVSRMIKSTAVIFYLSPPLFFYPSLPLISFFLMQIWFLKISIARFFFFLLFLDVENVWLNILILIKC